MAGHDDHLRLLSLARTLQATRTCVCFILPGLSLVLLTLGMVALFLDLEHKAYFWRLYTTFEVDFAHVVGRLDPDPGLSGPDGQYAPAHSAAAGAHAPKLAALSDGFAGNILFYKSVGIVNMVLGGLLGVYTGILLSSLGARPLWNTPVLGLLFMVSGLSSRPPLST